LILADFLREMRAAPYGAGGTMLVLALAHAVRAFGERLRIFSDSTHTEAGDLGSYEAIAKAVGEPSCKIELAVREITPAQRDFWTGYARRDLAGFAEFVASAPVVVPVGDPTAAARRDSGDGGCDVPEDILKNCGLTAEDVKKYGPKTAR
jgi:hypothetical protein